MNNFRLNCVKHTMNVSAQERTICDVLPTRCCQLCNVEVHTICGAINTMHVSILLFYFSFVFEEVKKTVHSTKCRTYTAVYINRFAEMIERREKVDVYYYNMIQLIVSYYVLRRIAKCAMTSSYNIDRASQYINLVLAELEKVFYSLTDDHIIPRIRHVLSNIKTRAATSMHVLYWIHMFWVVKNEWIDKFFLSFLIILYVELHTTSVNECQLFLC